MASATTVVSLLPSGVNGRAEQEEGRCSGGDTHHSASESVLWNERHITKTVARSHRMADSDPTAAIVKTPHAVKCSHWHLVPGGKDLGGTGGIITPPVEGGI